MHHSRATYKSGYLVKIKFYPYQPLTGEKHALSTHSNRLTGAAKLSTNNTGSHHEKKSQNTQSHLDFYIK